MADVPKLPEVWGKITWWEDMESWFIPDDEQLSIGMLDEHCDGKRINLTSADKAEAVREFAETHGWELPIGAVDEFCRRKGLKTLAEQLEVGD